MMGDDAWGNPGIMGDQSGNGHETVRCNGRVTVSCSLKENVRLAHVEHDVEVSVTDAFHHVAHVALCHPKDGYIDFQSEASDDCRRKQAIFVYSGDLDAAAWGPLGTMGDDGG